MKNIGTVVFIGIIVFALNLQAVVPKKLDYRSKEDFLKGKLQGVSVSFEGVMTLSPKEDQIEGPAEDFYLSFLLTADGTSYLGTGHSGKVYKLDKNGKAELFFKAPEMDVTCLAQDGRGPLYVGTSPNGKIYKITGKDQEEVFFNPGEKYIWDLAFADNGSLLAAVGEGGGIYEINPKGEGELILKAEENHILCLEKDRSGNFIAGSGGTGVVYRISPGRRASLLFESPFEEIKSLALDGNGDIYAAAGGSPSKLKKAEAIDIALSTDTQATVTAQPSTIRGTAPFASSEKEPGALYIIRPDSLAKKVWESNEELIYSLFWDEGGKRLLFGTGSKGCVYSIDRDEKASLLIQGDSEQAYALMPSGGNIFVLFNNPTRLTVVSPEQRYSGEYTSDVIDAKTISSWGKIEFDGDLPQGVTIQLQTRSGNSFEPNQTWSDWSPPYQKNEEQILSPKGRYLQYKVLFKTQSGKVSPQLRRVTLFYLQSNIAPRIRRMELLPPNEVYLKPPDQEEIVWGTEQAMIRGEGKKEEGRGLMIAKKVERKGYQTVVWEAEDENGDDLLSSLSIRREGENAWRLLKNVGNETLFAFDTLSFPDGVYFLKLEISDLPSNPPGSELRIDKISRSLTIDNSLPVIKNFSATRDKNFLEISFQAEDSFSAILQADYLIRPGQWQVIFPADNICDSRLENFKARIPLPPNNDNLITIRVKDAQGNIGVYRQNF